MKRSRNGDYVVLVDDDGYQNNSLSGADFGVDFSFRDVIFNKCYQSKLLWEEVIHDIEDSGEDWESGPTARSIWPSV